MSTTLQSPKAGDRQPTTRVTSRIFEGIAFRYDHFNKIASLGLDGRWRRKAAEHVPQNARVLDLGCGTGDFGFAALERASHVTGLDFSHKMLEKAEKKALSSGLSDRCRFQWGLADGIPFPDESFDCVISGFVLRSLVGKMETVLKEARRVLKPGGSLVLLEHGRPEKSLMRALHGAYIRTAMPTIGWAVTHQIKPFLFLKDSIQEFYTPAEFTALLSEIGFQKPGFRPLSGGIVGVFHAQKGI